MDNTEIDEITWSIHAKIFPSARSAKEAAYLNTIIRKVGGKAKNKYVTMLDVPCGEGRLDNHFRRYGYKVYGIDLNPRFIKAAKEKHPKYSNNYFAANMKSFRLNKKFDIILCWFTSFGYLNEKDNLLTLKNFSKHLNKGGLLIIDVANKDWYVANNRNLYEIDEYRNFLRLVISYLVKKGNKVYLLHTSKIYKKLGKNGKNLQLIKSFKQPIRLYGVKEMVELLDKVGIKVKFKLLNKAGRKVKNRFAKI